MPAACSPKSQRDRKIGTGKLWTFQSALRHQSSFRSLPLGCSLPGRLKGWYCHLSLKEKCQPRVVLNPNETEKLGQENYGLSSPRSGISPRSVVCHWAAHFPGG